MQPSQWIFIVGPSSTGKTTLCTALVRELRIPTTSFVTEVARDVMRRTGFSRDTVGRLEMQAAILAAQTAREDALHAEPGVRLSDRSGIDPIVYAILTAADENEAAERRHELTSTPSFERALAVYRSALFVLLSPVAGWLVDDGVRTVRDHERCLDVFRGLLADLGIAFFEIGEETKDLDERVGIVKAAAGLSTIP
jgi:nicotinamide riboside kinase